VTGATKLSLASLACWWAGTLALADGNAAAGAATRPARANITIGKETTHILRPLGADGTVNYIAYLNAKYGRGVTKANNAAVGFLDVFGPNVIKPKVRAAVLKRLGIGRLRSERDSFVLFDVTPHPSATDSTGSGGSSPSLR
jgi:hypothetical protein